MLESLTPGAKRALDRAFFRARYRGGSAVEPLDLLAGLVDEAESRAVAILARCGLEPAQVLEALGADPDAAAAETSGTPEFPEPTSHSPALRLALQDALRLARLINRSQLVGTEHLLRALLNTPGPPVDRLVATGVAIEEILSLLDEEAASEPLPIPISEDIPPLVLAGPAEAVDLARIFDAAANRAGEGLRVIEDYTRFVLDDPMLTRRLKETRHRFGEAVRGLDLDARITARDTRGDVGTHITTVTEQVRENPRAVLSANFRRVGECLRSLEEYSKLVDIWLAGRFEGLRYDIYTLEKLVLTAVTAYRSLAEARLCVLVGGLATLGDLTWVVGEVLAGGAEMIQLREKGLPDREILRRAREVRILTAEARARFILNDRPDLARLSGADGVHLGQDDLHVRDARRVVGPQAVIGVSTHNREQLDQAILDGAGYLGVGPVFSSGTKSFEGLAGLKFVAEVAETTTLPWFAIGGITEENLEAVLDAGAERIAVSAAVIRAEHPRRAAAALRQKLDS